MKSQTKTNSAENKHFVDVLRYKLSDISRYRLLNQHNGDQYQ